MIDNIFKIGVLVIGVIFLILFYQYNQKNRYQLHNVDPDMKIFDTNSGLIYMYPGNNTWAVVNPIRGGVKEVPLEKK